MSGTMFFKKQTDKAIPAEILTAHNKVMEIINKELNTYNGAVAEYSNHVRKFCEFIGDVINIGLENTDHTFKYDNIFEYIIPSNGSFDMEKRIANEIIDILENCSFVASEEYTAKHVCGLHENEFVWTEGTILLKI